MVAARAPNANPSSKARKLLVEPESLDMKSNVPMGIPVLSSFWAHMMGPIVLVHRWSEKRSKELIVSAKDKRLRKRRSIQFGGPLPRSDGKLHYREAPLTLGYFKIPAFSTT